jgi:hypothetical protein
MSERGGGQSKDLTFSRGARFITGAAPTDFDFTQGLSENAQWARDQT